MPSILIRRNTETERERRPRDNGERMKLCFQGNLGLPGTRRGKKGSSLEVLKRTWPTP